MKLEKIIQQVAELEAEALLFAEKCSLVRKQLERIEGSSPAPQKGKIFSLADKVRIAAERRARLSARRK
jgi:hypothetical protein